jgi:GDPmannose 4,6-dehydratase
MPRAIITGITGQDGSYLAELLLRKGYQVYGLVRRLSAPNYERIEHILNDIALVQGDLLDQSSLERALDIAQPDEVYNLASMSHVGTSFQQPIATAEQTGLGVVRLLEAMRGCSARFYQASTSELFGGGKTFPQNERTPFHPRSPYGIAKLYAHWSTINYRESYGVHASAGILFNHESPRRGLDFVTRKITCGLARIKHGLQDKVTLGNLEACRDWGYAGDYVEAMWLMLQQEKPGDYVIATGETHSIEEFFALACECAGLPHPWQQYVEIDEALYRPAEVNILIGDASRAKRVLGWQPHVDFIELVATMVDYDMRRVSDENQSCAHSLTGNYYRPRLVGLQAI